MKIRNTILACVLSFVVGGVLAGCVLGSKFLYWMKIVSFGHSSGEIATAIDRAEEAYFNEPPVVAVWELKKLLQLLTDREELISRMGKDPQFDMRDFHKDNWAVAGARLIRTYEKLGDQQEADRCVSNYLSKVHMFGGASITNKESILFIADSADRCLSNYLKKGVSPIRKGVSPIN